MVFRVRQPRYKVGFTTRNINMDETAGYVQTEGEVEFGPSTVQQEITLPVCDRTNLVS